MRLKEGDKVTVRTYNGSSLGVWTVRRQWLNHGTHMVTAKNDTTGEIGYFSEDELEAIGCSGNATGE